MALDKLTIVIPTHERHNLLMRSMEYYNDFNNNFIIVDSSQTAFSDKMPGKFKYLHMPKEDFGKKIYSTLSYVNTEYSCLCADDDFLSESGLIECLSFLENNDDYVSAQGRYISFNGVNKKLTAYPMYTKVLDHTVNSENKVERIKQAFNPYMHQIYAVHKTNILYKAFSIVSTVKNTSPVELAVPLVGSIYGKHKMLPVFWMARDQLVYTSLINEKGRVQRKNIFDEEEACVSRVVIDWKSYLLSEDGKLFKNNYCELISEVVSDKNEQCSLFDAAFAVYLPKLVNDNSKYKINLNIKIKMIVKKSMPNFFLHVYRIVRDASYRYKYRLGYPWSNELASNDWKKMKEIILKHREKVRSK